MKSDCHDSFPPNRIQRSLLLLYYLHDASRRLLKITFLDIFLEILRIFILESVHFYIMKIFITDSSIRKQNK